MSPDQQFAKIIKISIFLFSCIFIYFIFADLFIPMTPESRYIRPVAIISSEISGPIEEIYITNGQSVAVGEKLVRLNQEAVTLKLETEEINLNQAFLNIQALKTELSESSAAHSAALETQRYLKNEVSRLATLTASNVVSKQSYDKVLSQYHIAQAQVMVKKANIQKIEIKLGNLGEGTLIKRKAINAVNKAKLALKHTTLVADVAGVIANLHLSTGHYVTKGQPLLSVITDTSEIVADFREKSLRHVKSNVTTAYITFDAKPGDVYPAKIMEIEQGVSEGQYFSNGLLAKTSQSDRWVRDAQRLRVRLKLVNELDIPLPSGSRATVQLVSDDIAIFEFLSLLQIKVISWLHYVY